MDRQAKQKGSRGSRARRREASDADVITDPRFAKIQNSALYRLPSRNDTHVTLDSRFAHMLKDERFTSHAKVDRWGRQLDPQKGRKQLQGLYRTEQASSDESNQGDETDAEAEGDEHEVQTKPAPVATKHDPARDGGYDESSSEESSSEDDEELEEREAVTFPEQATAEAPAGEVSARFAVVNLDWDNIQAQDLLAVFSSFQPEGGRVLQVAVYPSEYGKERMEREDIEGPPKEIFTATANSLPKDHTEESPNEHDENEDEDDDERIKKSLLKNDEGEEFNSTQLRRYQIDRLRYYYAVVTCSSTQCAKEIYEAVDGREYLSSANYLDLRFIPDEMDFSDEAPRDECERLPDRYKPNDFVTGALQHSKVTLSWDAEDTRRKETQRKAFSGSRAEMDENDLRTYLASDSSEDEQAADPGEKQTKKEQERQRMRDLLGLGAEAVAADKEADKMPVGDMQITFTSGLSSHQEGSGVFDESDKEETTIQKYARKEMARKEERKKTRAARLNEPPAASADAEEEKEDLGFDDPFFTNPEQDKANAVAARKAEKRKRQHEREAEDAEADAQRAELERLLVAEANTGDMAHFDTRDLERGEKALRKLRSKAKRKGGKLSARTQQAMEAKAKDTFAMDVDDPRFRAIYQRNEFAVDPSHPKFKDTEAMQALLEEARRKRARGTHGERKAKTGGEMKPGDNVQNLLARVKNKSHRV